MARQLFRHFRAADDASIGSRSTLSFHCPFLQFSKIEKTGIQKRYFVDLTLLRTILRNQRYGWLIETQEKKHAFILRK
jgi:hypothetical protein